MRVSQQEKEKTHQRIVQGAARLVRERGIANTSVADVMSEAGLTNGGFYRHFEDKDALVEAALLAAFEERAASLERMLGDKGSPAAVRKHRSHYLSDGHLMSPGIGCPIAALGAEVGRGSPGIKRTFGAGVRRMIAALEKGIEGSASEKRTQATRELATMVGAMILARACDAETAQAILSACR